MNRLAMRFLPAAAYFEELLRLIPSAKRRIVIHAMIVLWGPRTERLVPLLEAASARGVQVHVIGDIFTKIHALQPRFSRPSLPTGWKHTLTLSERLRSSGIRVTYTGRLRANPFARRTHSKITLIDDNVFTFGGVNFSDDSLEYADYMLRMHSAAVADRLYDLTKDIERDNPPVLPDMSQDIGPGATLLFDGGKPGSSVIYQTACDTVEKAKKVYFVSQMCPSGRLARLITGTDHQCYFVRPSQTEFPANIALWVDQKRFGIQNLYSGNTYIHAKFILTEGRDGSRHLISGSNNYSWRGIAYGTKEIALHSTDPLLWQEFYDFMQREIIQP